MGIAFSVRNWLMKKFNWIKNPAWSCLKSASWLNSSGILFTFERFCRSAAEAASRHCHSNKHVKEGFQFLIATRKLSSASRLLQQTDSESITCTDDVYTSFTRQWEGNWFISLAAAFTYCCANDERSNSKQIIWGWTETSFQTFLTASKLKHSKLKVIWIHSAGDYIPCIHRSKNRFRVLHALQREDELTFSIINFLNQQLPTLNYLTNTWECCFDKSSRLFVFLIYKLDSWLFFHLEAWECAT